jgi:hypothetical protein
MYVLTTNNHERRERTRAALTPGFIVGFEDGDFGRVHCDWLCVIVDFWKSTRSGQK